MRLSLSLLVIFTVFLYIQGNAVQPKKEDSSKWTRAVKNNVVIKNQSFVFGMGEYLHWYDANKACVDLGLQMLTLDTQEKNDMIFDWLSRQPDYEYFWYWTAGNRPRGDTEWRWFTPRGNITYTYTNWGLNQPSRILDEEACTSFRLSYGGWDDDYCLGGIYLQYICEEIPK